MASSVNRAEILGNMGSDPEVKFLPNGSPVANFNVATSSKWKDKTSGEMKEKTQWHRIVVWGKLAELCGEYLSKGARVYISGRMETRSWDDKTHPEIKHYQTEVVADEVIFLNIKSDRKGEGESSEKSNKRPSRGRQESDQTFSSGDDGPDDPDKAPF